jgi:hypothetical protein
MLNAANSNLRLFDFESLKLNVKGRKNLISDKSK